MSTDGRSENQPQLPSLADLFRPRPESQRGTNWQNFRGFPRQREITQRQIEQAAAARLAQEGQINFNRRDGVWTNADGTQTPLSQMTDARLHDLVCWCVNQRHILKREYGATTDENAAYLSAELWLRERPLFISLVLLAAQRAITLPPTVFSYINRIVLPFLERIRDANNGEIDLDPASPEHDPALLEQQQDTLDRLAQLKLRNDYGPTLRHLDL